MMRSRCEDRHSLKQSTEIEWRNDREWQAAQVEDILQPSRRGLMLRAQMRKLAVRMKGRLGYQKLRGGRIGWLAD